MKKSLLIAVASIIFIFHSCNCFGQDQPIGQIPFTLNANGHIVISLQINQDNISDFVLDTGASVTVIDKTIATQLGLSLQHQTAQITGASDVNNDVKKTHQLRISLNENIVLKGLEMYVSDLSPYGAINGLIGFDLFREYITETNFDTKTINFYERKAKPDTKGYESIKFKESFCTPEIDISVLFPNNESVSGIVLFDTGNMASPLIFSSPFVLEQNLPNKFNELISTEFKKDNDTIIKHQGITKVIQIDDFKISKIPITLSGAKKGVLSDEKYIGILGLEYISKFNFILNYHKKKIYLKPNASFNKAFNFPLGGIGLENKEKEIFIKSIAQPSMAYEKGLRAGQQLISIDGVEGESIKYYKESLKKENKEVTLVVKLEDGTIKTIDLVLLRLI